jgi:hypothetical protein
MALDHRRGDADYSAYARSDLLDARRNQMDAWAQFVNDIEPPKMIRPWQSAPGMRSDPAVGNEDRK